MTSRRGLARAGLAPDALLAAGVFAFAAFVHRAALALTLLGWDTYSTILASRIESLDDFRGTFTELMMDGQLEAGAFYRPVGNLSIAFDHALWGLDPFGYQLTQVLLFAGCAAGICLVAQRMLGARRSSIGPLTGALFYVLHPLVLSVLPVVARRTELLSTLFLLGALGLTPAGPGSRRPTARAWGTGVLVALSFGAKESGLVGLPILFVQHWTTHRTLAPAARLRSAIPAIAPAVLLCGLAFGVRMAVIGGLGGYVEPAQGTYLGRLFGGFIGYVSLLGMTSPWDESAAAATIGTLSILAMAAIACVAMLSATTLERDEARRGLPLAATGATWVAFQVAVAGNSVEFSPRYAFGMLAGASLMLAAVVDVALRAAREGTGRRRALGVAQLALAMIVVVGGLRGSPAWHAYPGLAKASRIESDELAALATLLATDPPKGRHPFSVQRQVVIHARAVDHAWMLAPWSVQAWVDLRFPELALRVERDDTRPRSAKYWHLVMTPKDAEHGR